MCCFFNLKKKLACVEKCSWFSFSHLPISQFVIQLLWKESSTDTREGVKSGADVIYSDPLSVFASIACSCAVMPDGTDLFADAQTELLCVCTPVCTCVWNQSSGSGQMFESLYKIIDVWRESLACKHSPKRKGKGQKEFLPCLVFPTPSWC